MGGDWVPDVSLLLTSGFWAHSGAVHHLLSQAPGCWRFIFSLSPHKPCHFPPRFLLMLFPQFFSLLKSFFFKAQLRLRLPQETSFPFSP